MAYAQVADVKARAGVIAQAWGRDTEPSDTDIERVLQQVSDEIDAAVAAAGFATPVTDPVAVNSLASVVSDKALAIALDATFPNGGQADNLRGDVKDRVKAYDAALSKGQLAALVYLGSTSAGQQEGGASDFWSKEGAEDYYWSLFGYRQCAYAWATDAFGVAPTQGPEFRKGMRL